MNGSVSIFLSCLAPVLRALSPIKESGIPLYALCKFPGPALRTGKGEHISVDFSASTFSFDGLKVIQCSLQNITERKRTAEKLERHKQLYSALSHCNKTIVHCPDDAELFQQICRAAVQFGGMKMAWIGLVQPETRMVKPVASFGSGTEHLDHLEISTDAKHPCGMTPTGIAIREDRPYWCQDLMSEMCLTPVHPIIQHAGWASLGSLPLHRNGIVIGAFILYSSEINAFDELARNLLVEMAMDAGFALDYFDREMKRKHAEEHLRDAEEQFRGLVEQSIAGIYIVQHGKFVYVNPRIVEIAGLNSEDDLIGRDPLQSIVEPDRSVVAEKMRGLIKGDAQNIAIDFGILRPDGHEIRVGANAARARHLGEFAIIGVLQDVSEMKRAEAEIKRYVAQLEATLNGTIEVVETIGEMRDPYTAGHERRVARIAVAIAAELGFDAQQQEGIRVAATLHDVGKIMAPAEILSKPGKLSPVEYTLIQGHAQAGYDVLKNVSFPWPVAQIVLQHHERMDGSGYPQGLQGDSILMEARILAVADVVEAMSSHRPYRPGLPIDHALNELKQHQGVQYDSRVVDACLNLFLKQGFKVPE
jgi:PAS domain S-box-containing protein/putative nucleotidyltransferase with HDIG domain